jgi:hypothetical protein
VTQALVLKELKNFPLYRRESGTVFAIVSGRKTTTIKDEKEERLFEIRIPTAIVNGRDLRPREKTMLFGLRELSNE